MKVNGYKLSMEEYEGEPTIYAFIDEDFSEVVPLGLQNYEMSKIFKAAKSNEKMVEIKFEIRPCDENVNTYVKHREYRLSEEEIKLLGGIKKALMLYSDLIDREAKTIFKCPLIYWNRILIRPQFVKYLMKSGEIKCYGDKEKRK